MLKQLSSDLIWKMAQQASTSEEFFQLLNSATDVPCVDKYRFDHLAIPVSDPNGSLEWYQSIFEDVQVLFASDEWVFIRTGGVKLAFVKSDKHPAHFSFEVDEEAMYLIAERLELQVERQRPDTLSLFIVGGPGDICIELVHYLVDFDSQGDTQ